jgi:hypothetical protein
MPTTITKASDLGLIYQMTLELIRCGGPLEHSRTEPPGKAVR